MEPINYTNILNHIVKNIILAFMVTIFLPGFTDMEILFLLISFSSDSTKLGFKRVH